MSKSKIDTKIVRASLDLEFLAGKPPEDAIRFALVSLFTSMAKAIERYDGKIIEDKEMTWFAMAFPMEFKLWSEQYHLNFRFVAKIMNALASEEET